MEQTMSEKILVDASEHILTITFNRPEKYNAMDPDTYNQLARALYQFEHDSELRVAVIQANGQHFTTGLELDKWAPILAKGGMPALAEGHLDPYGLQGKTVSKPLIIATQGICFTAGLELVLNCDIRLATVNTRFAQLEVQRGLYPCGGGTVRLPLAIGWGNAQRYLLTGDEFTAEQALQWGMVQEIVAFDELHQRAREMAQKVAKAAPLAVRASLRSSQLGRLDHADALTKVFDEMSAVMNSEDAAEGVQSFVERRAAKFIGR
jgi:enoyl-CoA hydratase